MCNSSFLNWHPGSRPWSGGDHWLSSMMHLDRSSVSGTPEPGPEGFAGLLFAQCWYFAVCSLSLELRNQDRRVLPVSWLLLCPGCTPSLLYSITLLHKVLLLASYPVNRPPFGQTAAYSPLFLHNFSVASDPVNRPTLWSTWCKICHKFSCSCYFLASCGPSQVQSVQGWQRSTQTVWTGQRSPSSFILQLWWLHLSIWTNKEHTNCLDRSKILSLLLILLQGIQELQGSSWSRGWWRTSFPCKEGMRLPQKCCWGNWLCWIGFPVHFCQGC